MKRDGMFLLIFLVGITFFSEFGFAQGSCTVGDGTELFAYDGASFDNFGSSVAVSGNVAVVTSPRNEANGIRDVGALYVFRKNGLSWNFEQKLTAPDGTDSDRLGLGASSVAIEGNVIVVGARHDTLSGSAYVYRYNGNQWIMEQKLIPSEDTSTTVRFGTSVSLSGNVLAIGGVGEDGYGNPTTNLGSVYIYRYNGNSWVQDTDRLYTGLFDGFGWDVSLSGDTLLVSAHADTGEGTRPRGAVYVYRYMNGAWQQTSKIFPSDIIDYEGFGFSLALSGNRALIGAKGDRDQGPGTGSAYVYNFNGNSWVEETELYGSDTIQNNQFAYSVALDGDTAIIGAQNYGRSYYNQQDGYGAAYIFKKVGQTWNEEEKLVPSRQDPYGKYGSSVSLSDEIALVGAMAFSPSVYQQGVAYIYTINCAVCNSGADTAPYGDCDGVIESDEIINYINGYYSGNVNIEDLSTAFETYL